jgi:hypothetical protein
MSQQGNKKSGSVPTTEHDVKFTHVQCYFYINIKYLFMASSNNALPPRAPNCLAASSSMGKLNCHMVSPFTKEVVVVLVVVVVVVGEKGIA